MKIVVQTSLIAAALAFGAQAALAEGDADTGRQKAETCLGCHASPNIENVYPMYRVPKVAGQHAEYLTAALKAYRDGQRPHKTMQANAASLSDQDIEDIAAYFASAQN
ncbi:MAG: c-type cytochrome [bacterium]